MLKLWVISDIYGVTNIYFLILLSVCQVVQCVAPKAALCCSRTFFLGSTHTPYLGEHLPEDRVTNCQRRIIEDAYQSLIAFLHFTV